MMKYQIDKSKTSPVQMGLEERSREINKIGEKKVQDWKNALGKQINQLDIQYHSGADVPTLRGTKMYIDCLISAIEEEGRECPQKNRYHLLVDQYEH